MLLSGGSSGNSMSGARFLAIFHKCAFKTGYIAISTAVNRGRTVERSTHGPPGEGCYDFVIVGSGFGGSVSAMRLTGKGYRVLVLERGKRYRDEDFPRSNWNVFKYLWFPALRCFGIQNLTLLKDVLVLHGTGVGGGSLVYANVLMEPDDVMFEAPAWRHLADWKQVLRPHYDTARRMLGVTTNPRLWPADNVPREVAGEMGRAARASPYRTRTLAGKARRATAARTAGAAWSAAATTPRTRSSRTTSTSRRSGARRCAPRRKSPTSVHWRASSLTGRATRS